jgi:hypothetical protein
MNFQKDKSMVKTEWGKEEMWREKKKEEKKERRE